MDKDTTFISINPVSDEQQTVYKPEEAHHETSNINIADLTLEPPTWPDVSLKISSIIPLKDQLDKFGLGYLLVEQDTVKDDQDENNKLVEEQFFIEIQVNHNELDSCSSVGTKSSTTNFQDNFNKSFPETQSCNDLKSNYKLDSDLLLEDGSSKIDSQSILNELTPYSLLGEHSSEKDLTDNVNKLSLESPEEEQLLCKTLPNNICLLTSQSLKKSHSGKKNVQINGDLSSSCTLLEEQGSNKNIQNDLDDSLWDHSDEQSLIAEYLDEQGENVKVEVFTYFCSYCNDTIVDTNSLLSHQYMTHPEKVFKCTVCGPAVVLSKSKPSSDRFLCDKHTMQPSWETNETSEYLTDRSTPEMSSPSTHVSIPSDDFTSLEISLDGDLPYLFDNFISLDKTMSEENRIVDSFPSFNIPFVDMPKDTSALVDVFIPTIASATVVASIPTNITPVTASIPADITPVTASIPADITTVTASIPADITTVTASIPADITTVTASIPADITPVTASIPADITPVTASIPADITTVTASIPADITTVTASIPADIATVTASIPADIATVTASIPADITTVTASIPADITTVTASIPADITTVTASIPADITTVTASIPADITPVTASIPADITTVTASIPADITTVTASIPADITTVTASTSSSVISSIPLDISTPDVSISADISTPIPDVKNDENVEITSIFDATVETLKCFPVKTKTSRTVTKLKLSKDFCQINKNVQLKILEIIKNMFIAKETKQKNKPMNIKDFCVEKDKYKQFTTKEHQEEKCDSSVMSKKKTFDLRDKIKCLNNVCCYCNQVSTSKKDMEKHNCSSNTQPYTCEQCEEQFGTSTDLEKHMSSHDPSGKFSCANCGKCYEVKWKLKLHMRIHSDTKLTCDICGQTVKRKGAMREHMYLKHKLGEFHSSCMCEICGEKFMNRFRLAHHRHTHFDKESLKCQICSQVYQSLQDLESHMHIHANMDTYNCNACKLVFDTSHNLQKHLKTHKDLRNENCSGISSKIMLHLPDDERPVIKCSKCYKILSSKQNLNYHMKIHINEKNYTCNICNESFLTPSARSVHLRVHLDKKPYICEVCDAGFLTATRLKRHEYIHTRDTSYDDRPFSCTVCTKAFRRKDTLNSHMKVHTTERLHSCIDCGRTFKKCNDRDRHRRNNCKISIAIGQPPTVYSCPICKESFKSSASASNHLAFVHVLNKNSIEENCMPIGTDEPIISSLL